MKFYKTPDRKRFVCAADSYFVAISKSDMVISVTVYLMPFNNTAERMEAIDRDEFFAEYDTLTAFVTALDEAAKPRGIEVLLPDSHSAKSDIIQFDFNKFPLKGSG